MCLPGWHLQQPLLCARLQTCWGTCDCSPPPFSRISKLRNRDKVSPGEQQVYSAGLWFTLRTPLLCSHGWPIPLVLSNPPCTHLQGSKGPSLSSPFLLHLSTHHLHTLTSPHFLPHTSSPRCVASLGPGLTGFWSGWALPCCAWSTAGP